MSPPCMPPGKKGPGPNSDKVEEEEEWSQSKCFENLYYSQRKTSHELATKLYEFKDSWLGSIYCQFNDCYVSYPF